MIEISFFFFIQMGGRKSPDVHEVVQGGAQQLGSK